MTSDYLNPRISPRGFLHMPGITSADGGSIRVYESSDISQCAHVWIFSESRMPGQMDEIVHQVAVHLPVVAATHLAQQILFLTQWHHMLADPVQRDRMKTVWTKAL